MAQAVGVDVVVVVVLYLEHVNKLANVDIKLLACRVEVEPDPSIDEPHLQQQEDDFEDVAALREVVPWLHSVHAARLLLHKVDGKSHVHCLKC